MCTAECAKILRRYNEMRLTSNDQRRHPSPTPKYRGSGLKRLKTGYKEFAWLESSADATPAVTLSPAVAMAAEIHCQRPPAGAQSLAHYLYDAPVDCH